MFHFKDLNYPSSCDRLVKLGKGLKVNSDPLASLLGLKSTPFSRNPPNQESRAFKISSSHNILI